MVEEQAEVAGEGRLLLFALAGLLPAMRGHEALLLSRYGGADQVKGGAMSRRRGKALGQLYYHNKMTGRSASIVNEGERKSKSKKWSLG